MPLTRVTKENVKAVFTYQPWTPEQTARGEAVRNKLIDAVDTILDVVLECPARTRAINALVDARMLANSAISLEHLT